MKRLFLCIFVLPAEIDYITKENNFYPCVCVNSNVVIKLQPLSF